jgi:hypothetical protein
MAVGDWMGAEQSNRPDASQQGVAVVSEGALERTRGSSLPEALGDKQVHTTHSEIRCNAGKPSLVGVGKLSGIPRTRERGLCFCGYAGLGG